MAASSRRSSTGPILRSHSPSGRFHNPHAPPSSTAFASSSSTFSVKSPSFFPSRSASPTRLNLNAPPSVRFSLDYNHHHRSNSTVNRHQPKTTTTTRKKTCMYSPTTHPGSFRCSLHKGNSGGSGAGAVTYSANRLNARRSAMTNSLVRIGGVEGELVKRALTALIRPSSHHQRRRNDFQPRPSRLSVMSKAEGLE